MNPSLRRIFGAAGSWLGLIAFSHAADRPNILWITLEDTSPHFIGCYGNPAAKTPNIDRLAARGIRFERAFANAPVCSSARSAIITGIVNERLGTGNHRSAFPIPDSITGFPTYLRKSGYYTTNNSKTDYSTSDAGRLIRESWDESSGKAGWWKREEDEPFFSVFNINSCHQSRTMTWSYDWYRRNIFEKLKPELRVADGDFEIPPFFPDTPEIRKHFARVYNSIAFADHEVGKLLGRLDADGLTEDTIIFCYADHGEAMPRGKANAIGLGYRVPFIVVFPEKWKHLNPWGEPGTPSDELVCFDDLAPTMLSLTGTEPPAAMTGRAFLGKHRERPRPHVFLCRNRIDETAGCSRSITDGRFLYTRHFLPGPELKPQKYFDVADISRILRNANRNGKLDEAASAMFRTQPHEVLYDLEADPWEVRNLAADLEQAETTSTLREKLFKHLVDIRDVMLLPEYELSRISKNSTPMEHGNSLTEATMTAIVEAADLASRPEVSPRILELVRSKNPIVTYWAATALRNNPDYSREGLDYRDFPYAPARIEFAAARFFYDGDAEARQILLRQLRGKNLDHRLQALQLIQSFGPKAAAFEDALKTSLSSGNYDTVCSAEMILHSLNGREISYPDPK